ncbi:MAG: M23 family metallopeptidase [Lachnospiraceae bacterium]|nr:M23 family metallopeptidase [Lachnospiraceae bacterium]
MKKRMWLLLFLIVLAALDVIGMDRLRLNAAASASTDDKDGTDSSAQNRQTEAACNDGVPPEEVSAVIREELKFFPIPQSLSNPDYEAYFDDSWMSKRTFGGERGHEGTDIMLDPDERGLFPVLSMTDGVVEKKGWLPQGGYRLGIRSSGGIYYYYAHLYDYAQDMEPGTTVVAGQLLGFAGDSGYSNIEGTVGNFPVHLHVGIYYNDARGAETAVNPYPFLLSLEKVIIDY